MLVRFCIGNVITFPMQNMLLVGEAIKCFTMFSWPPLLPPTPSSALANAMNRDLIPGGPQLGERLRCFFFSFDFYILPPGIAINVNLKSCRCQTIQNLSRDLSIFGRGLGTMAFLATMAFNCLER